MIKSSANKVTSFLYYNNYIDSDKYDYEVYLYGFESIIALILNTVSILLIGLLFDRFMHTVVFLLCYYPLRQFTGGYHADTYEKCFFTFVVIFIATIFIANHLGYAEVRPLILLFSVINYISICLLSPVDHINNILTDVEKVNYKKKARLIATSVLLFIFVSNNYFIYSAFSLFWINILLNVAFIKNKGEVR
ncbi:accessory gene regulator protein B [[Clostridium] sordellii]|uniref:accessory gene regulator ArgB-like protein n=1 Tax=Paraclostridium sordellii TaxID=1505 RepID=UPI0005DBB970|nr:accessory gene regulator B family protein [Paeniclostridium sordellii]CEN30901.1 accessory gene regulator protein B [[Clostridium] sordellii] [Paeniclostridium sordellii]